MNNKTVLNPKRNVHLPGRKPLPIPTDIAELYIQMTQAQLAKHYNVSRTTINKWLRQSNINIKQEVLRNESK